MVQKRTPSDLAAHRSHWRGPCLRGARTLWPLCLLTALGALTLAPSGPAAAEVRSIVLQSGNAPIGSRDPLVWVQGTGSLLPGVPSAGTPLQHPFIWPNPPYWGVVEGGRWLSADSGGNGPAGANEYFVDFELPANVTTAFLNLTWRADNLGYPALNGVRLPGSATSTTTVPPGVLLLDVSTLVRSGTNRFSIFVWNVSDGTVASPTGVAFVAALTYSQGPGRTFLLQSGNGPAGSRDPLVWVQGSSEVQPTYASSGLPRQHPFILPTPSYWGEAPGGRWVSPQLDSNGPIGGYEYFVEFELPSGVTTAFMDLVWRADNWGWLGFNGVRVPGVGRPEPTAAPSVLHLDLAPFLQGGTNRLSFFVMNFDSGAGPNPTGVDFLAAITISPP